MQRKATRRKEYRPSSRAPFPVISLAADCRLGHNRSCQLSASVRRRRSWQLNLRGLTRTGLTEKCLQGEYLFGRQVMCVSGFPLKAGMPQKLSERAVLKFEVGLRQIRAQTASPKGPLDRVTCAASLNTVLETPCA